MGGEARLRQVQLTVIYAWHIPALGFPGLTPPYPKEGFIAGAQRVVEAAVAAVPVSAGARVEVREGHPRDVLVDASLSADLVVVGAHGHGRFPGTLLGTVSAGVAMRAHCPVVIVRHHDD